MRKRFAGLSGLLVGIALFGSVLTGCGKKEEDVTPSTNAQGTQGGKVDSPNAPGTNTGATGTPAPSGR